jgi:hypothetical protein
MSVCVLIPIHILACPLPLMGICAFWYQHYVRTVITTVRMHAEEREKRKQDTTAFIMAWVANIKSMSAAISLPIEKSVDVIPSWAQYMEEKWPNNYIM